MRVSRDVAFDEMESWCVDEKHDIGADVEDNVVTKCRCIFIGSEWTTRVT